MIHPSNRLLRTFLIASVAAFSVVACRESPFTAPSVVMSDNVIHSGVEIIDTTYSSGHLQADSTLWFRRVWVCKVGTSAEFAVSVNGGAPTLVSLNDDDCKQVHYYAPGYEGGIDHPAFLGADTITVTELLTDLSVVFDSVTVDSTHNFSKFRTGVYTTPSRTVITTRSKGALLFFYNSVFDEPPGGGQGCTPGYWKQSQHFDSWNGYSPNQLFSSVFEDAFPGMTLLQVLGQGGGGIQALGRHTVAALLNSAQDGVSFDMNTAGVISAFNSAFPGDDYETLKDVFVGYNEQGCPIS